MKRHSALSRRELLAGLGLGMGMLPVLSEERARAAGPALRTFIIQWTNGVLTGPFWPSGGETGFALSSCLKPLEPYKNDIIVVRGLNIQACKDDPLAGAGHQSLPHLLTGARGAQTNITGGDDGSRVMGNSISIDQAIANEFSRQKLTPIPSLELAVQRDTSLPSHGYISFKGKAKDGSYPDALTPNENPYDVFKKLFQGAALGKEALDKQTGRRKLVVDFLQPELKALQTYLGRDDKRLLEEHLTAVAALDKQLSAVDTTGSGTKPACATPSVTSGVNPKDRTQYHTLTKMQIDLAVAAFRCDITRVGTLMLSNSSNTGTTFTWLGDDFLKPPLESSGVSSGTLIGHHEIAHAAGDGTSPAKVRVDTWFVEQFAYALKRLKETPDPYAPGKTLLENSVVVLVNHMGNGASHSVDNAPFLLGGQAGGYFKTGRSLNFGGTPHNGLLVSLGRSMGLDITKFGAYETGTIDSRLHG